MLMFVFMVVQEKVVKDRGENGSPKKELRSTFYITFSMNKELNPMFLFFGFSLKFLSYDEGKKGKIK